MTRYDTMRWFQLIEEYQQRATCWLRRKCENKKWLRCWFMIEKTLTHYLVDVVVETTFNRRNGKFVKFGCFQFLTAEWWENFASLNFNFCVHQFNVIQKCEQDEKKPIKAGKWLLTSDEDSTTLYIASHAFMRNQRFDQQRGNIRLCPLYCSSFSCIDSSFPLFVTCKQTATAKIRVKRRKNPSTHAIMVKNKRSEKLTISAFSLLMTAIETCEETKEIKETRERRNRWKKKTTTAEHETEMGWVRAILSNLISKVSGKMHSRMESQAAATTIAVSSFWKMKVGSHAAAAGSRQSIESSRGVEWERLTCVAKPAVWWGEISPPHSSLK